MRDGMLLYNNVCQSKKIGMFRELLLPVERSEGAHARPSFNVQKITGFDGFQPVGFATVDRGGGESNVFFFSHNECMLYKRLHSSSSSSFRCIVSAAATNNNYDKPK